MEPHVGRLVRRTAGHRGQVPGEGAVTGAQPHEVVWCSVV